MKLLALFFIERIPNAQLCTHPQHQQQHQQHTYTNNNATQRSTIEAADGRVMHVVAGSAWNGAAFKLPTALDKRGALLQSLVDTEHVELVECNQIFTVNQPSDGVSSQAGATWGLDRIDQAAKQLDSRYDYTSTGSGVCAYVVDTGVYRPHNELTGRVLAGYNVYNTAGAPDDDYGHGAFVLFVCAECAHLLAFCLYEALLTCTIRNTKQ